MEPWTKEDRAEAEWARQQAEAERRERENRRNAVIAFALGLLLVGFGVVAAGTSSDPGIGRVVALLGVVLVVLGVVLRGRRS